MLYCYCINGFNNYVICYTVITSKEFIYQIMCIVIMLLPKLFEEINGYMLFVMLLLHHKNLHTKLCVLSSSYYQNFLKKSMIIMLFVILLLHNKNSYARLCVLLSSYYQNFLKKSMIIMLFVILLLHH